MSFKLFNLQIHFTILQFKKSKKYMIHHFDFYLRIKSEVFFINIDDCFTQAYPTRNDYLCGRMLLRLRSSWRRRRQDIVSDIVKNNVHTTYIHGLCRTRAIYAVDRSVYRSSKVPCSKTTRVLPFFFIAHRIQKWEGNRKERPIQPIPSIRRVRSSFVL